MSENNIIILSITGLIFPYKDPLSQLLGAATLDRFTQDFQKALNNPAISNIVLNIDSPGGMVTGVHECAEMIYQARNKKPITAYISGMAASAAYWLASSCDEIVIDATASVGSIGVLSTHTDDTAKKSQQGISQIQIVSSQSPRKRLDIATDEGKADVQTQVDAIAEVFVSNVARNRNVSIETVLTDFGQGSLFIGKYAVEKGLADRLGSLDQLIKEKTNQSSNNKLSYKTTRENTMTDSLSDTTLTPITIDNLLAEYPDLVNTAQQNAAKAERERIQAVEDQGMPGHEDLVKQLKFDGKTTGAEAALQILAAEELRQAEKSSLLSKQPFSPLPITNSMLEEAHLLNQNPQKTLSSKEQWQMDWQGNQALQAEFGSMEVYLAFRKSEENRQILPLFTR